VEAALADIDLRFSPKLEILDNLIGRLEAQAKESVLSEGKTDSLAARCKQYSRKVASVGIARNWTG